MKTLKRFNHLVGTTMVLVWLFSACTEVPPRINYSPEVPLLKDTTYSVNPVPEADDKNVLIEDITGIRCNNCPDAAKRASGIKSSKDDGRVVIVAIHPLSLGNLTRPLEGDSFNTQDGEDIIQNLIGAPQGLPAGPVNRRKFDGENSIWVWPAKWNNYADEIYQEKSPVNLEVEANIVKDTRIVVVNAKMTFTQADQTPTNMTILLLENDIVGHQISTEGKLDDYIHEHVLRRAITPYSGLKLADEVEAGTAIEKGLSFTVGEGLNIDNCSIVVMVNKIDGDNKEVLQVTEVKLKK